MIAYNLDRSEYMYDTRWHFGDTERAWVPMQEVKCMGQEDNYVRDV